MGPFSTSIFARGVGPNWTSISSAVSFEDFVNAIDGVIERYSVRIINWRANLLSCEKEEARSASAIGTASAQISLRGPSLVLRFALVVGWGRALREDE